MVRRRLPLLPSAPLRSTARRLTSTLPRPPPFWVRPRRAFQTCTLSALSTTGPSPLSPVRLDRLRTARLPVSSLLNSRGSRIDSSGVAVAPHLGRALTLRASSTPSRAAGTIRDPKHAHSGRALSHASLSVDVQPREGRLDRRRRGLSGRVTPMPRHRYRVRRAARVWSRRWRRRRSGRTLGQPVSPVGVRAGGRTHFHRARRSHPSRRYSALPGGGHHRGGDCR